MSVNKYEPHVWLIVEDSANLQLVNGFLLHDAVRYWNVGPPTIAHGWAKVPEVFERDYLPLLRRYEVAHVVMLLDFDEKEDRRSLLFSKVPDDVKPRVFVIGSKDEPETLKRDLKMGLEEIGTALAHDCFEGNANVWGHPHVIHNEQELHRLVSAVKPFLIRDRHVQ